MGRCRAKSSTRPLAPPGQSEDAALLICQLGDEVESSAQEASWRGCLGRARARAVWPVRERMSAV